MILSEAIDASNKIIACYPNGGGSAGAGYIGALAATLASYPRQVANACADQVRGVTSECKFLPTVADIIAFCERAGQPLYREVEREDRLEEQFKLREREVPSAESIARIEEMRLEAKRSLAGPAEMSVRGEENEKKAAIARDKRLREVRREWGDQEPPTIAGTPVSRELVASMQRPAE